MMKSRQPESSNALVDAIRYQASLLFDTLFPVRCLKCGKLISFSGDESRLPSDSPFPYSLYRRCFCDVCIMMPYEPFSSPFCTKCGKKFETREKRDHLCQACVRNPGKADSVRAASRYRGLVKESIHMLKYSGKLALASPLETLMFMAYKRFFSKREPDVVVPVPLHPSKLRKRGFNQSFLLVRHFPRMQRREKEPLSRLDINPYCLERVKKTYSQTGFTAGERKENIKGAFRVVKKNTIVNRHVLLVDDVYTTGATAQEAATELINAGALAVDVLVAARA